MTDLSMDNPQRRPIKTAADQLARWLGIIGGIVVALVSGGVLTAVQGDAVTGLLGLIPGVLAAVATFLTAFGIVKRAEPHTTPLSDPRDDKLRPLVALPPNSKIVPKTDKGDSSGGSGPRNLIGGVRADVAEAATAARRRSAARHGGDWAHTRAAADAAIAASNAALGATAADTTPAHGGGYCAPGSAVTSPGAASSDSGPCGGGA